MKTLISAIFVLLGLITGTNAQQVTSHVPWTKEDSAAINALALYPDSIKVEIFTACEYPAIIVNVASLQKNSSAAFADMLSSYPKSKQEDVYNLSRYPGLISRLVDGGKLPDDAIENVLSVYPAEIHDLGLNYGKNEYELLSKVNDLQNQTNQQFQQIISSYPADIQTIFTNLLQMPEVMSLLNDHLALSVRVGDHYKRDPQWVMHKSDSNAAAQAKINAEQLEEWKQTIQNDSNARNDLKDAGNEYATDNGYNQSDVDAPVDANDVTYCAVYPYSYWFGYPTWYPYAYWYPYPYWYDWGFYYGPYGEIVVFGFPSYYFTNWYFWYPRHWHRYPCLGSAYIHHYYGPHRLNTMSRQVVHNWVHENRRYLPADFIKNDGNRVNAIRQFGDLNEKVMDKKGMINTQARDQYLAKNAATYPALNSNPAQPKIPDEKQAVEVRQPYTRQPVVNPARTQTQKVQPMRTQPPAQQQRYNYNNTQQAQQYHSGGWEQAQPSRQQQQQPQQQQQRQQTPPRATAPAPQRSSGGGAGRKH